MTHVTIKRSTLVTLLQMANSHLEDIQSGLEGGLYDPPDNEDLPTKEAAAAETEKALEGIDGLRVMLDASTWHLIGDDRRLLDRMADRSGTALQFPRAASHEYGWCVFLTGEEDVLQAQLNALRSEGAGKGLLTLIERGAKTGAYILNLDADADAIPGVPLLELGEEVARAVIAS